MMGKSSWILWTTFFGML